MGPRSVVLIALFACDAGELPPKPSPAPKPAPPPPVPTEEPRPPVAADLALYTRDLPNNGDELVARIETTQGTLTCKLFAAQAPMTVANFIGLATGKKAWRNPTTGRVELGHRFYDGLTFHRAIASFMIQGGDPLGVGSGGPGYTFDNEIWEGAHIRAGSLAMANAGIHDQHGTNGSQFFVMESNDRPDLDANYTLFGACAELEVVKRIARVKTDDRDKPIHPVTIRSVKIEKAVSRVN